MTSGPAKVSKFSDSGVCWTHFGFLLEPPFWNHISMMFVGERSSVWPRTSGYQFLRDDFIVGRQWRLAILRRNKRDRRHVRDMFETPKRYRVRLSKQGNDPRKRSKYAGPRVLFHRRRKPVSILEGYRCRERNVECICAWVLYDPHWNVQS